MASPCGHRQYATEFVSACPRDGNVTRTESTIFTELFNGAATISSIGCTRSTHFQQAHHHSTLDHGPVPHSVVQLAPSVQNAYRFPILFASANLRLGIHSREYIRANTARMRRSVPSPALRKTKSIRIHVASIGLGIQFVLGKTDKNRFSL